MAGRTQVAAQPSGARVGRSGRGTPDAAAGIEIDETTKLRMYRTMIEARAFEKRANELFLEGVVRGTTHLAAGQEAVAAGFAAAMRKDDYTFCTYRGHHHTLARGVSMTPILLEMVGKQGALMGGKGGSMHITSVEHGAMGSYAIVGAHLPIALGAAWSAQYRRSGQVAVCFFGDGTTNIGAFHEALNMAAVWKAPVVFVCENNLYMEYTPIRDVTAVEHPAADRAAGYGLESIVIDGNDPDAVFVTARKYIERARSGGGPALIEAMTYRHGGHSRADPGTYRPKEEVASWLARDPIPAYRAKLVETGIAAQLDEMDKEAARKVAEAEAAARSAPEPDPAGLETQLWSDGGSSWRANNG
jgi:acetoin:2,6-dichlorophenolindophenol oxidoreductase subunit alpha